MSRNRIDLINSQENTFLAKAEEVNDKMIVSVFRIGIAIILTTSTSYNSNHMYHQKEILKHMERSLKDGNMIQRRMKITHTSMYLQERN